MKQLNAFLVPVLCAFLLVACSHENDTLNQSLDLTVSLNTPIKEQSPHVSFDNSANGIYHGILASNNSQSRGKIWINVGNNTNYNALVELVGEDPIEFSLVTSTDAYDNQNIYVFGSDQGNFVLDLTNSNEPVITEAILNNNTYASLIGKSRSMMPIVAITGTFSEEEDPTFSGTWNLLSDGTILNPNGSNGQAITSLMITIDGGSFTDVEFDAFNATDCLGLPVCIPSVNANGISNYVISSYQTTAFADGIAKWGLGYNPVVPTYVDWLFCETTDAGYFDWTSADGTLNRIGKIFID